MSLIAFLQQWSKDEDFTPYERRKLAEAATQLEAMQAEIEGSIALLTELIDGPSKGEFYGIGPVLRAKLDTIRLGLRASLDRQGKIGSAREPLLLDPSANE